MHGTATAASIWATAGIGVAAGYARYDIAILLSLVGLETRRLLLPSRATAAATLRTRADPRASRPQTSQTTRPHRKHGAGRPVRVHRNPRSAGSAAIVYIKALIAAVRAEGL